jgi:hypothetical protein
MNGENSFVTEDGKSFTVIKDIDDNINDNNDDDLNNDDPMSLVNKVDLTQIPEAQRPVFSKIIDTLKTVLPEIGSLKEKGDIAETLRKTLETISDQRNTKTNDGNEPQPKPKLVDSLKFEEGDYYAPFFKQLAGVLDNINESIDGLGSEVKRGQVLSFQDKVISYIKNNDVPKNVVLKMDELAKSMGNGVYNDLPRLRKLALIELGIPEKKPEDKINNVNDKTKNSFETRNRQRSPLHINKTAPKSMMEAWDRAEQQLAEE